jgi:hypothetical protein
MQRVTARKQGSFNMTAKLTTCVLIAAAGLLSAPVLALAQTAASQPPTHIPLQKTIGQAGTDIVPSLIVMNARGARACRMESSYGAAGGLRLLPVWALLLTRTVWISGCRTNLEIRPAAELMQIHQFFGLDDT